MIYAFLTLLVIINTLSAVANWSELHMLRKNRDILFPRPKRRVQGRKL